MTATVQLYRSTFTNQQYSFTVDFNDSFTIKPPSAGSFNDLQLARTHNRKSKAIGQTLPRKLKLKGKILPQNKLDRLCTKACREKFQDKKLHHYKYYSCISRLRITTCFNGLAVLRSGVNCLGIAIPMLRIALKDCNKLFIRLLLHKC